MPLTCCGCTAEEPGAESSAAESRQITEAAGRSGQKPGLLHGIRALAVRLASPRLPAAGAPAATSSDSGD